MAPVRNVLRSAPASIKSGKLASKNCPSGREKCILGVTAKKGRPGQKALKHDKGFNDFNLHKDHILDAL